MGFISKLKHKRKMKKLNDGLMVISNRQENGGGNGYDIWGEDWLVPVAEKLEWTLYDNTNDRCQYLRTKLTDKIFFFIPFSYDEYIFKVPEGFFQPNTLTNKDVVNWIYYLEHWTSHLDEVYFSHEFTQVTFLYEAGKELTCKLGDSDYDLICRKDAD